MIPRLFLVSILTLISQFGFSQEDTLKTEMDTTHSVRKATLLSVVVPGAGQICNHFAQPKGKKKAFWKVPLIYAGLGYMGYSIVNNHSNVLSLRDEYRYREANNGLQLDEDWLPFDDNGILLLESQYANSRDYAIVGFIFVYALQIADAAVEAHFVNFDISEDLSLKIKPWTYQNTYSGISLSFNFR